MKTLVMTMCQHQAPDCPKLFIDRDEGTSEAQISITDDFGNTIRMSRRHLEVFVNQAKNGLLDNL